jgi:hypothetical protein
VNEITHLITTSIHFERDVDQKIYISSTCCTPFAWERFSLVIMSIIASTNLIRSICFSNWKLQ